VMDGNISDRTTLREFSHQDRGHLLATICSVMSAALE